MADQDTAAEAVTERALLGGPRVFRGKAKGAGGMQDALRRGLPYHAFEEVQVALGVGSQELADLLGVAARTLARRRHAGLFSPIESDRLYRVAHVTALAAAVLGSIEKARTWLRAPNRALDGNPPLGALDTEVGGRQVEELLHRIDHGIYS